MWTVVMVAVVVRVVAIARVMERVRLVVVMRRRMLVLRWKMMRAIWAGKLISPCRPFTPR